jgi:hypothetical protein
MSPFQMSLEVLKTHEEALMEAIECYAQFKADACKKHQVSSHDMTTVNCQEGSSYST